MSGGVDHRLGTDYAGDPNWRVRFLQRHDPGIDYAEMIVLPFPTKRSRRGPGLYNQIMGFFKPLPVKYRIGIGSHALLTDASNEPADYAPSRYNINHGYFFGYSPRVLMNGKDIAQEDDLSLTGVLGQHRSDNIDGRHHA